MRAKFINEYGDDYLPAGAANDPRAPYNQPDIDYNVEIEDGELVMHTSYGDETKYFAPEYVDQLLMTFSDIKLREGDTFELLHVSNEGDYFTVTTDKGEIDISYEDLEAISY